MTKTFKNPRKATLAHVRRAIEKRYPGAMRKSAVRGYAVRLARDLDRIIDTEVIAPLLRDLFKEAFGG